MATDANAISAQLAAWPALAAAIVHHLSLIASPRTNRETPRFRLASELVHARVHADMHPLVQDATLGDADGVVQPAIALVIGFEPPHEILPARQIAFGEDCTPAELENDRGAVIRRDQPAHIRQHPTIAAPVRIVRPNDASGNLSGRRSPTLAVGDPLVTAIRAYEGVARRFQTD